MVEQWLAEFEELTPRPDRNCVIALNEDNSTLTACEYDYAPIATPYCDIRMLRRAVNFN
jgi:hypothetical protein|tara:strand:- start:481 stop:657 length:177 start_codon:yes stop_codon:yes gene_type:complete